MDISMDIHRKSVDMDIYMDEQFHIHGKPGHPELAELFHNYPAIHRTQQYVDQQCA